MLELIGIDVESYFDASFTLKKLSTSEYIRDKRFEFMGISVLRESEGFKGRYIEAPDVRDYMASLPWANMNMLSHHCHFDGAALSTHLGHIPARYSCSMSMARFWHKGECRHSLDALSEHYGLELKSDVLSRTKGKHFADLSAEERADMASYAILDQKKSLYFYLKLLPHIPPHELQLIDLTVRMFADPQMEVDLELAREALNDYRADKASTIERYDMKMLRSAKQFAAELEKLGVEPPTKISAKTGKEAFAFASKDQAFLELQEHPKQEVRDLVEAKMEASSNIDITRSERLITMGETGKLAVYLHYSGAGPHRWSGGNRMNLQNFRRGSKLRKAIRAPKGYVIGVADSSQIECRMNAEISDQEDLLELFRANKKSKLDYKAGLIPRVDPRTDPYNAMGQDIYGYEIDRQMNPEHALQGFVSKTARLGLQYYMGAMKFQSSLATAEKPVHLPLEECYRIVNVYRQKNAGISGLWEIAKDWLKFLANGRGKITYKYLEFDADKKRVWEPGGTSLNYYGLEENDGNFTYISQRGVAKYIHGGTAVENITQWLCRVLAGAWMLEINERYRVVSMSHDEILALIPEREAEEGLAWMIDVMRKPLPWCQNLPLDAEGKADVCYSK